MILGHKTVTLSPSVLDDKDILVGDKFSDLQISFGGDGRRSMFLYYAVGRSGRLDNEILAQRMLY